MKPLSKIVRYKLHHQTKDMFDFSLWYSIDSLTAYYVRNRTWLSVVYPILDTLKREL